MNVETLMRAMPGLDRAKAQAYLPGMEAAMNEFGITNLARCRMWLAQIGHESVSLRYMEEIASGAAYENRRDLGNTQPGDGRRFKGRGPIQLTGRANYAAAGKAMGLDLVGNPKLAGDPAIAFRMSAWWWQTHSLNEIADTGDVRAATRRINGGLNGLADRQRRHATVCALGDAVLPGPGTAQPPPRAPDENMIVSCVSASGTLHVFVATEDALYFTYQKGGAGWNQSGPGRVAGLSHFCSAPDHRKINGVAAALSSTGVMHVFVRFRDGTTAVCWQAPNETSWSGGGPGKGIAGLSYLAPKP